jgi:branched-chain amino acid transport system permease protein
MTVNTRRTKMAAFMFSAFGPGWRARFLPTCCATSIPATFGIQKLAEVLAMVYFGGLNSVVGSVVGAVSISVLGEALRPLEIYKWIFIPLLAHSGDDLPAHRADRFPRVDVAPHPFTQESG